MPRFYENHTLSHREMQVIELAGRGFTDGQIAEELGISESTVTTYWDRIRLKYGAHHRTELVLRVHTERCQAILAEMRAENERLLDRIQQANGPLLHEILDDLEEPVIVVEEGDRIRLANLAAEALFGFEKGQMNGMRHAELVPEELRAHHEASVKEYYKGPRREEMGDHVEVWARHRLGNAFRIHAYLTPLHAPSGLLVMCRIEEAASPAPLFEETPTPAPGAAP